MFKLMEEAPMEPYEILYNIYIQGAPVELRLKSNMANLMKLCPGVPCVFAATLSKLYFYFLSA
jgi:hypothetical protein